MTKTNKLAVVLNKRAMQIAHVELSHLYDAAKEADLKPEVQADLEEAVSALSQAIFEFELMEKATVLETKERYVALEHPEHGDEASIMLFDRKHHRLHVETCFHDPEDEETFAGWLDDQL